MQQSEITTQTRIIISKTLHGDARGIVPDPTSKIVEDLGADSLSFVEIIMAIEDHFDIEIPDESAEKIVTVEDLVHEITGRLPVTASTQTAEHLTEPISDEVESAGRIPFTDNAVMDYLDGAIKAWRIKRDNHANNLVDRAMAEHYVDAYQSVRTSLFGETLP